jgi:hypothetical protein
MPSAESIQFHAHDMPQELSSFARMTGEGTWDCVSATDVATMHHWVAFCINPNTTHEIIPICGV